MTTKEYLKKVFENVIHAQSKARQLEALGEIYKNMDLDKDDAYIETRSGMLSFIGSVLKEQQHIVEVVDAVDNPVSKALLSYHYIEGMSWDAVAMKMNYTYHYIVVGLHRRAIKDFEIARVKVLGEKIKRPTTM